jgi:PAS domain S-box-containing protein/putative nucleotidyltransferase with HDIG domain
LTTQPPQLSLPESELRYRRLFETAQDGILILDFESGCIEDVNPFLTQLLGYSRADFIGKQLWEMGSVLDKAASINAIKVIQEKGYIRYEDLPLRRKDGRIINVEFVSNAYRVNGNQVIQCNIRDISERIAAEKELDRYLKSASISMRETIDTLAALNEARDPYTAGHQARVADLCVAIAQKMGLPLHAVEGIRMSALVHDIGKIAIPAEVLTKPTQLNSFEIAMLRNHVQAGFDVLKHIHFPWPVAQTVLQHHERLDGSGYPNGVKGDSICEEAKILAVADTVEAMTSNRPYRFGLGLDVALETIQEGRGTLFDAQVVDACVAVFRENHYQFLELKQLAAKGTL